MEVKIKETKEIFFKLDEKEARWLKGIMQNSLHGDLDLQSPDEQMRMKFWDALESIGILL